MDHSHTVFLTKAALRLVWFISDEFFESLLSEDWFEQRPIHLRNPFGFYYGHLAAFTWNQFRKKLNIKQFNPVFDYIFERGIDPDVDDPSTCHSHPEFPETWPSKKEIAEYKHKVRTILSSESVLIQVEKRYPHIIELVAEHEMMHLETLFYMFVQLDSPMRQLKQKFLQCKIPNLKPTAACERLVDNEPSVFIQGGFTRLGREFGKGFGWDIEFPSHIEKVKPFTMNIFPVTVGQFYEFVCLGGYRLAEYWQADDFEWLNKEKIWFPSFWVFCESVEDDCSIEEWKNVCTSPSQFRYKMPFGDVSLKDAFYLPVYVSLAEAEAFAKWKGMRIPTEAQVHGVMWGFSSTREESDPNASYAVDGNFGFQYYGPIPVGMIEEDCSPYGIRDIYGNGWELTCSVLRAFPGFQPLAEYPNYSADFFDEKHYVILGSSWCTDSQLVRPSFRNWYQRRYPFVFSKFHLVKNVEMGDSLSVE
eukprot:jgi/Galph1/2223/GphlegSOOS_G900.1